MVQPAKYKSLHISFISMYIDILHNFNHSIYDTYIFMLSRLVIWKAVQKWDSCVYTAEEERDFVVNYLGKKMTDIGVLKDRLEELNPRDKQIMVMRYGLYNTKEYTQKEVASILGISQSYISRIEKKVIKRLKLHLE